MTTYTLTEMFPNIDESVISYVYTETNGNLEKSINLILEMINKSDISNYMMKTSENSNIPIKQKTQDFLNLEPSIVVKGSKSKYSDRETNINNDEIIAKTLNDEILARTIQSILMFDYINNNQNENNDKEQISTKKKEHITNKKNFFKKFGKKFTELFSKFSCGCVGLNNKKTYSQIDMEEPLNNSYNRDISYQQNNNMSENTIHEVKTEDINLEIEEEPSLQHMNKSPRSISSSKIFI